MPLLWAARPRREDRGRFSVARAEERSNRRRVAGAVGTLSGMPRCFGRNPKRRRSMRSIALWLIGIPIPIIILIALFVR